MNNLKEILNKYQIQIPIIQRDYAQGRIDLKTTNIRNLFLSTIYDKLKENSKLHLDFIYGSIKEKKFFPLDGQQRLTTLFLLYWYFGKKEKKDINFLKNFTYETRASSREFCNKLIANNFDLDIEFLNQHIIDSKWYLSFWNNDPTIKSMLIMINEIHQKFKCEIFFDRLDNLTFDFFELEKFGLDDDLYIKMNARGKALTDFEIFKAKFEKHLSKKDKALQIEFSTKIDNIWTDKFWKYSVENFDFIIDSYFMNFFNYITEMLLIKKHNEEFIKNDFKMISEVYYSKSYITFLFKALDKIDLILNSFDVIFSNLDHFEGKICLYDENINILDRIIRGKFVNTQHKILLFFIISHLIDFPLNDNLKDLLRVIRNLTYRIRHLKPGKIGYTTDLGTNNIYPILNSFQNIVNKDIYNVLANELLSLKGTEITNDSFNHEVEKGKFIVENPDIKSFLFRLEDNINLKGDIQNFLTNDLNELIFRIDAIENIYSKENDSLIIRSMLTIQDFNYTLEVGWTILGNKYYFGKNNYWEAILTSPKNKVFFDYYLDSYKKNNIDINEMIEKFLKNCTDFESWRYYFVKYEKMTMKDYMISRDENIYAWKNDFEIEKMGGSNLNAFHFDPYLKVISEKTKDTLVWVCSDSQGILRVNDLEIYSYEDGWMIKSDKNSKLKSLLSKYEIEDSEDEYYFIDTFDKLDRIETLIQFIEDYKTLST